MATPLLNNSPRTRQSATPARALAHKRLAADWLLIGLMLCIVLPGCGTSGPATYNVQGTVTYDGEVVPTGYVIFLPSDSKQISAEIGADGSYQTQLPAGTHKVGIFAPRESNKTGMEAFDEPPKPPHVPTWFNEPASSGISATIQENDENTFDITLTKAERRRR